MTVVEKRPLLSEIAESTVEFNRIRYRNELAQGIYELMLSANVTRTKLAELMDVDKSRISHILSGDRNLQADSLADILLVLGRTPHLVLGTDVFEIRFPTDEAVKSALSAKTYSEPQVEESVYDITKYQKANSALTEEGSVVTQQSEHKADFITVAAE